MYAIWAAVSSPRPASRRGNICAGFVSRPRSDLLEGKNAPLAVQAAMAQAQTGADHGEAAALKHSVPDIMRLLNRSLRLELAETESLESLSPQIALEKCPCRRFTYPRICDSIG